jgi:hypothetical protein
MPNVAFVHPSLKKVLPSYARTDDVVAGDIAVKAKGETYLPRPNAADVSADNLARYAAYKARAVFYNFTRRTLKGLVGQVFGRAAEIKLSAQLQPLIDDASGSGVSLNQLSKRAVSHALTKGRCGILADFPVQDEGTEVTVAQIATGEVRPALHLYDAPEIINWRTIEKGTKDVLSLVVLQETYVISDDGFEFKTAKQWRVLRLDEAGNATVTLYRKTSGAIFGVAYGPSVYRDRAGDPLKTLPFFFIGADTNDAEIDDAPLHDLAVLNVAHYRNSADYEDSCFLVGQPTPVFSGLTEDWVNTVMNGQVSLGSRGGVLLPVGGDARLLEATANTMPFEAMQHKERQAVALGAKIVEQQAVQRTATEVGHDVVVENSVLVNVALNVSAAVTQALNLCQMYVSDSAENLFRLNTDFAIATMKPEERAAVVREWMNNAITWKEMRTHLRRGGVVTENDEQAKAKIAADMVDELGGENNA